MPEIRMEIDGVTHVIPDEKDWEFLELGEVEKLRAEYGQSIGSLMGSVWFVKHRIDPTFTIEQAKHMKFGQIGEVTELGDPLPESSPQENGTASVSIEPSSPEAPGLSGTQVLRGSMA